MKVLDNMQTSESSSDELKVCSKCGGKKEVYVEIFGAKRKVSCLCPCEAKERDRLAEIEERKQRMHRLENLKRYSLMDKQFKNCTFENFEIDDRNKKMYQIGKDYCKNWPEMKEKNMGILLYGPPGTGKTFLAFCIANELLNNMVPVIAISSIGLLNKFKETYNTWGDEGEIEIINSLKNADLLVLDDLGAENNTDWSKGKIYEIIDARYRDEKPCIITTNLTRDRLKKKFSSEDGVARTYDRITKMCCLIEVQGPSRRAEAARKKQELFKKLLGGKEI